VKYRSWFVFAFAFATVYSFAQTEIPLVNDSSTTMTTPAQLRRIEPPSANASASELEENGDILRAEKYYADAIDYYEAAIHKSAGPAQLYNKEGIAQLQMLHFSEAKHMFEHAIKGNARYPEATNNLGVVYYNQRNYGKAIRYYHKAIALNADSASFHSNLGTAYFAKHQYEKASQEYATALSLDPEIFERHSQAGITAHMSSPEDRALYSYVIAKMFATRGDADHCLLYLKKAMEEGFKVAEGFQKDHEFVGYRKDPRFLTLLSHGPIPLPN
jgi:tetratricopeptide (TPR) repeat protein